MQGRSAFDLPASNKNQDLPLSFLVFRLMHFFKEKSATGETTFKNSLKYSFNQNYNFIHFKLKSLLC
jgi:hypothetical protein